MFDDSRATRRAILGSATTAVTVGLAGCGAVLGDGSDSGSTPAASDPESNGGSASGDGSTSNGSSGSSDPGSSSSDAAHFRAVTGTNHGVDLAQVPVIGAADPAVDIYYWSDYQCPFCKEFETETYPKLLENEVADGTARLALVQYPNIGSASASAALLAKGVWQHVKSDAPDRFGTWHSHIFENQEKPNSGWAEYEKLLELTREVDGVDTAAVDEYVRSNQGEFTDIVKAEKRAGEQAGISGTPGFMLYDRSSDEQTKLMGAQPYSRFEEAIANLSG